MEGEGGVEGILCYLGWNVGGEGVFSLNAHIRRRLGMWEMFVSRVSFLKNTCRLCRFSMGIR